MEHIRAYKVNQTQLTKNIQNDSILIFRKRYLRNTKTSIIYYSRNVSDQDKGMNKEEKKDGNDYGKSKE